MRTPQEPESVRTPQEPEPGDDALRRAEADLARRLEEACDAVDQKDLCKESMGELLRLEEELFAAARATQAVLLRRQLADRAAPPLGPESTTPASEPPPDDSATTYRLREFRDPAGREWRVWQVRPRLAGRAHSERYLAEYVKGWLAFELLGGELRKRLPSFPEEWLRMSDAELNQLLRRAVDVPPRKAGREHAEPHP